MFLMLSELISVLFVFVSIVVLKISNLSSVLRGKGFCTHIGQRVKRGAQCPLVAIKVIAAEIRVKGPKQKRLLIWTLVLLSTHTHFTYTHIHTIT